MARGGSAVKGAVIRIIKVKDFEPLAMLRPGDCGPTALLQVLRCIGRRIEREELIRLWGFREGVDRLDTPGHHLRVLCSLGVPAAVRRRLGRREITRAVEAGRPVVLLVPVGLFRWHWIVACGADRAGAVVSDGTGNLVALPWEKLLGLRRRRPEGRVFRVDGLGYAAGLPFPFEPDRPLERDLLRLAALAEEALAPVEPVLRAVRSMAAIIGWKRRPLHGNLFAGSGSLAARSIGRFEG